jgi:uncharacterized protein (DUF433 family)
MLNFDRITLEPGKMEGKACIRQAASDLPVELLSHSRSDVFAGI